MNKTEHSLEVGQLARMLRSPLPVTKVSRRVFTRGPGARDEVIATCRFILILKGSLMYNFEGNHFLLQAGSQFLVPSWCRRTWTVQSDEPCEIIWCEFDDDPQEIGHGLCLRLSLSPSQISREKRAYLEMLEHWKSLEKTESSTSMLELVMEGQLKSMLARFWPKAELTSYQSGSDARRLHPELKKALRYLEDHFTEPQVLESLHRECALTPNYFRQRFKEVMACSPSEYIKRLRLRHSRYLLHSTNWQTKRIAAEVGYGDPLYFSRIYHQFWGHSPRQERNTVR